MNIIAVTLRTSALLMLVCGLLYHLAVTGIAQAFWPHKADGSLIYNDNNEIIGSELIGQTFSSPNYFHGRVSSIDNNAIGSGTPNYAPSHQDMIKRTKDAVSQWQADNPDVPISKLPIDLISNSGSGLDPHISPESAEAQIPRVSQATGIAAEQLQALVDKHTEGRELGVFGEPRVNVLNLNVDLQTLMK